MLKNEKILTVNNVQVLLSREIYYYWPLNSNEKVDKIVGKISFFFALSTAVLTQLPLCIVRISRWQKSELSVFKAKR